MSMSCSPGTFLYRVQSGDTLYRLAQRYGTTVSAILAVNPGIDPNRLSIGQMICIPGQVQPICSGQMYTVRPGDTLSAIAQRFGVTLQQILAVNPQITNANVIFIGQSVCIPISPQPQEDCAIVLSLSGEAFPALPAIAGGVVLIQQTDAEHFAVTFAATGLPLPETIGNFNAYIGTVNIMGQAYSAILERSAPFEQEPTWAGTRLLGINPFTPESFVTIAPFHIESGTQANPILGGMVSQCRRA